MRQAELCGGIQTVICTVYAPTKHSVSRSTQFSRISRKESMFMGKEVVFMDLKPADLMAIYAKELAKARIKLKLGYPEMPNKMPSVQRSWNSYIKEAF
jgi:hypothetical protein